MEGVLDSVRRIISRWIETATPITSSVTAGDTRLHVNSSKRFKVGDEVMIESPLEGEPNLIVENIIDNTTIDLVNPVFNTWSVDQSPILRKLINGMFVEGVYIGSPNVIPRYPAITVNGTEQT